MSMTMRAAQWLGLARADTEVPPPSDPSTATQAPARSANLALTTRGALSLSSVYRAVQILDTAASQLSIDVERPHNPDAMRVPGWITRPHHALSRSAFLGQTVVSMATTGEAFWLITRTGNDPVGDVLDLEVLNPGHVTIHRDQGGKTTYRVARRNGEPVEYKPWQIKHLPLMRVPGFDRGLGPIQAARVEISGALDARDYSAGWYANSDAPRDGILKSEAALTPTQAKEIKTAWQENTGGVRVLGYGTSYLPLFMRPKDLQFIEGQNFTVTQIARLFGVPASLMLASVEGNSQTYSNVEQDWIGFVRFGLMAYLREIEEALSDLLPRTWRARFNLEALLRTDTKTRYEAHEIAIRAGFMSAEHAAAIEGLPTPPTQPARPAKETTDDAAS